MTTSALLIRHAQTDWNVSKRWQGHTDIPLNKQGIIQAESLAQRLANWPIEAIYTSDLRRAFDTASMVGRALDLQPISDPALRERNGGQFQGMTIDELRTNYSKMWQQVRYKGEAPPDGESSLQVARRIVSAYEGYITQHPDRMFAIVSHGGALKLLISYILGLPLGRAAPISLSGNTGLSLIRIDNGQARLALLNDTFHIDESSPSSFMTIRSDQTE